MKEKNSEFNQNFIEKILDYKAELLVLAGFLIRIFMLIYYYYVHAINPAKSWGDVAINYRSNCCYPPLTLFFLDIFRLLSFGILEIFAFWAFLLEFIAAILFYFVLKRFQISKILYAFGLFLVNPFFFLNNIFSLENCGYHITDSFFFIFLFLALIYYPQEKKSDKKNLFYLFLGLSAVAKIYTLPFVGFFFLKFLIDKNWKEMKKFLIVTIPLILIFLVFPLFFIEEYAQYYSLFNTLGEEKIPFYIRVIPPLVIFALYLIFRINKADLLEMVFLSILITATFLFFSLPFLRYFQPLLIFGMLKEKEFFRFNLNLGFIKREIKFDNQLLVFYSSFLLVLGSYLIIIFIL